ncbi:MAG: hypothetical protein EBT73_05515 [Actinobacteria bacterium]|nr:hypothetical protein [Actinomycetota bacterium]NDG76966.1 hypothetical protein [Acidimicrobiia bacterium]
MVFGEEKIRPVRRHLGDERRLVAEDHAKHSVGRDVGADFLECSDLSLVAGERSEVLPRSRHHVFGIVQQGFQHKVQSCRSAT